MTTDRPNLVPVVEFERFPFFVGMQAPDDEADLPGYLPMRLAIDPLAAIPRLILSPEITTALDRAYARGSMLSTPLGESPLARERLREMLDGLLSAFGREVPGRRFLEIGCGHGHLLNELKAMGADVTGCEIGPQAEAAERNFGIRVVHDVLRPDLFEQPFDCVFSYGCLEHIIDLAGFLAAARTTLKDGGLFFHSVPNTDLTYDNLRIGDLCHEHVSYFTAENGTRLLAAQGFSCAAATPTKAGNELHLWGYRDAAIEPFWPGTDPETVARERAKLARFDASCRRRLARQIGAVETMLDRGESVGFYAGGYVLGSMIASGGAIRYFDGDSAKHGKCWLAGLSAVRDPLTLRDDPVDCLVVFSEHYFPAIRDHLMNRVRLTAGVRLLRASELDGL